MAAERPYQRAWTTALRARRAADTLAARLRQALRALKAKHGFLLLVDDAHATLTIGASGGGSDDTAGLSGTTDIHVGTLSKAVGALGGFVACSELVKRVLVNTGRAYIYSTALPVPVVAGALAALDVFER